VPAPLSAKAAPGQLLLVKGTLQDEEKVIPFGTLDIWQAGPEAEYDYEEKDGVFKPYLSYMNEYNTHSKSKSSEYDYRCRVITDEQGTESALVFLMCFLQCVFF
jgi:protocatechuate 3,4-dioxygenase beta subunit